MKLHLIAGGALCGALLGACAGDPYYDNYTYGNPYYSGTYYGDRYYDRDYYAGGRVMAIELLRGSSRYRVTVRNRNGYEESYVMDSLGGLRVGDRLRLAG